MMKKLFPALFVAFLFCIPNWAYSQQSPQELIVGLMNTVRSMKIQGGVENSLMVKLEHAQEKLSSSQAVVYRSASNNLRAFKNEVLALEGTFLSSKQSNLLSDRASQIIDLLKNTTVEELGPRGGFIEINDAASEICGVSVSIPEGALSSRTLITISPLRSQIPLPSQLRASGLWVNLGPEGLIFSKPVTISIPVFEDATIDPEKLRVYFFEKDAHRFLPVESSYDSERRVLHAKVNHFSTFMAATGVPYIDWMELAYARYAVSKERNPRGYSEGLHIDIGILDEDCPPENCHLPDHIQKLEIEQSPGPFSYSFLSGDYWFDVYYYFLHQNFEPIRPYESYFTRRILREDEELPDGDYHFNLSVEDKNGKGSTYAKDLQVRRMPIVEASSVKFCQPPDDLNPECSEWRTGDLYEGVDIHKPLKIKWDPVYYEVGPVYYEVRIHNWNGASLKVFRSRPLTTATEIIIPSSLLSQLLIENAHYTLKIWAWDSFTHLTSNNLSQSDIVRFSTGNATFQSLIFDYARVLKEGNQLIYGARVRNGLNGQVYLGDEIQVSVKLPDGTELNLDSSNSVGDRWKVITLSYPPVYPIGEVIFKAKESWASNWVLFLRDHFYRPKQMGIPQLQAPGNGATINTLRPTFTWDRVPEARSYQVLIDRWSSGSWQSIFSSSWVEKTEYILPEGILENGNSYRWRVRAHDGFLIADTDNRSTSAYRYFSVSLTEG